uniref:Uncharacterized protein n=1 Tax=Octactis speculum TaxID=3111310 RepID=A0A7S2DET4_9STRA|mmetsp:Transcript_48038/g.65417  ORF Transcript_48038/g.65417 Transcript_48038/m.65417 type:complete len:166 (+) Transcript_48038:66-563(+)|eukprot:CAMPEP_0185781424 /NCGR_PEP_ID=MMETSP1174-20130828/102360_1 /TAXON_ID=35687 /ORGANISM="Dictyocha speculum, Strain CCMP1381" /LENGTH=165 /DNA_ID=CAMNT_0028471399 /DNA_START=66 /DNA_END=563 /DNA_ORIENTATION=+
MGRKRSRVTGNLFASLASSSDEDEDDEKTAVSVVKAKHSDPPSRVPKKRSKHRRAKAEPVPGQTGESASEDNSGDETVPAGEIETDATVDPETEEEYKQAIVMYLREKGRTTLAKLGAAVKKPPCVKNKSLKVFVKSILSTRAKRLGTSLTVEGDTVILVTKSNY